MQLEPSYGLTSLTISLRPDQAHLAQQSAVNLNLTVEQFIEGLVCACLQDFMEWVKTVESGQSRKEAASIEMLADRQRSILSANCRS